MTGPYINDEGYEVPENNILVVPHSISIPENGYYKDIIQPLVGELKRDWFTSHFYYCLPIIIGNQYGFLVKSLIDFDVVWRGGDLPVEIKFLNSDNHNKQFIKNTFNHGIITIQNSFSLKTPPGINIMTIQPPNMFIPGCVAMTGVVETDQIRRDFTFNIKVTIPNYIIKIRKGDPLGAFIPIKRNSVEKFTVKPATDIFDLEIIQKEVAEAEKLSIERMGVDRDRPHTCGRRYFNGEHTDGSKYVDHQKRINVEKQ